MIQLYNTKISFVNNPMKLNFSTARLHLNSIISEARLSEIDEALRIFEDACYQDELCFSLELCSLMHNSVEVSSAPAWRFVFQKIGHHIDCDDFFHMAMSLPEKGRFWLVQEGLNNGVSLNLADPRLLAAFTQSAPLEMLKEMIDLQTQTLNPALCAIATVNPDPKVFEFLLNQFSLEEVRQTLKNCAEDSHKGVYLSQGFAFLKLNPTADFVQAAIDKKVLDHEIAGIERFTPAKTIRKM